MKVRQHKTRGGFTLVELLVSITLTIFILSLFATLFGAGNDAVRAARGTGEVDRGIHASVTKIRRDLEHVYIGEGIKLSEAFASPNSIPNAGYFTIEENLPASLPYYVQNETEAGALPNGLPAHDTNFKARVGAINTRLQMTRLSGYTGAGKPAFGYRQGIDDRGLPVEVDVDDVLAFTVKLPGDQASEVFYGRVPVGSVLDNDLDPGSRFDTADNGLFTSPMAEVCYFLRPDQPYELTEINRPALGTDDGRLARTPTYTLYRRELLVLSESQRTQVEERLNSLSALTDIQQVISNTQKLSRNPSLDSSLPAVFNPSLYQQYDVAFRFDARLGGRIRFNDIKALRLRQNRYGMVTRTGTWLLVMPPQSIGPAYDYDVPTTATSALDTLIYTPNRVHPGGGTAIFRGRPTLLESTLVGSAGILDANYSPANVAIPSGFDFSNQALGFDAKSITPPMSARRGNADVLLRNVLSFDIKVLNDDVLQGPRALPILSDNSAGAAVLPNFQPDTAFIGGSPLSPYDRKQWPAVRTAVLENLSTLGPAVRPNAGLALAFGNYIRLGPIAGNASRRPPLTQPLDPVIQSDFIDLGQSLAREYPAGVGATFPLECRPIMSAAVRSAIFGSAASGVTWGEHTPARWASMGRREASFFPATSNATPFYATTVTGPLLGNIYDTWSPEYGAEKYADDMLTATPTVPKYLPPYDRPLRGIQITIRTLEPRSGIVKEFKVVHRF